MVTLFLPSNCPSEKEGDPILWLFSRQGEAQSQLEQVRIGAGLTLFSQNSSLESIY